MKRSPYPKYKSSGVEWLGDVPAHWDVKAIKWESPVLRGASPRPIDDQVYFDDEGEYAWVRIADVTASHVYLEETTQRLSDIGANLSVKLNPGKLFLSIAATVGVPCITKIKCCIHDGFVHFPRLKSNTKFMYYIFDCGEPYKGLGKLGTQLNLNTDTVGSIVMGFPPIQEQQAIAAFLDCETGRIDSLIGIKQKLIDLLKEKRTAMISHAVTKGLNPKVKMKPSGVEWLGDVPVHWDVKRAGLGFSIQLGKMLQPEPSSPNDEQVAYLKALHVQWENIDTSDMPVMWTSSDEILKYSVQEGDLLVCEGGEPGRAGILKGIDGVVIIQNALHRVRSKNNSTLFLMYILKLASENKWFEILCNKATIAHFTGEKFSALRIPYPPLPEQQAIADFLDCETGKIDALMAKVETAIETLKEYRSALISAVVTGKIDVREVA